MALDTDRASRRATFVLTGLAYLACEVAFDPDGRVTAFGIAFGLFLFVAAAIASYFLPAPTGREGKPPFKIKLILIGALVLPLALDPTLRELAGAGLPLELQLINGLRNLGLALAAVSAWPAYKRLAGVVCLFLALFVSAMGDQPQIPYLLVALACAGGVWLVLAYRSERAATPAAALIGAVVERVRLRLPVRVLLVFGSLAIVAIAVAAAGPRRLIGNLGELMPTSGGTGDQDPFARYGMNDGPEETRGENGNSVGMVESNSFIESRKDALLDVVSDLYGPPHKPPEDQERMVASGYEKVKQNHDKLPENRRPSRDFDTSRKGPKNARKGESRSARAVFEVEGRTPLHIAAVAYDRYDPKTNRWLQAPSLNGQYIDLDPSGGCWMIPVNRRSDGDWYAADDRHELKVADLKDHLVPTPAHTTRFRINRVDRPEYYQCDYDGVIGLSGRTYTPPGVIVQTDCRTLDPANLPADAFRSSSVYPMYVAVPPSLIESVTRLAKEWVGDSPRGWPQVAAILARLRADFSLDPQAAAPAEHASPVSWFLFESHRGPDYMFATAAALLLRSLDYPTRVCLGYYASPEAYDPMSQHTPVRKDDLHVWPEILLRDGYWLVVEPTPGYDVLPPKRPWRERVLAALSGFLDRLLKNLPLSIGIVILTTLLLWRRKRLVDALLTTLWRFSTRRSWQRSALATARLLERRGRLAGRARPSAQTLAAWAGVLSGNTPTDDPIKELVRIAEWAAYGPATSLPMPVESVADVCGQAVKWWTLRRFQYRAPAESHGGAI